MASILDFFKPVATSKRPREEPPVDLTSEDPSDAAPTTPRSSPDVHSRLRNSELKAQSETQSLSPSARRRSAIIKQHLQPLQFIHESKLSNCQQLLKQNQLRDDRKRSHCQKSSQSADPDVFRGEAAPGSQVRPRVKEEEEEEESPGPDPLEVEASFAESKVLHYSVNGNEDVLKAPVSLQDNIDRELVGFQVDAKSYLYDHGINKTYDISFTPFQDNGLVAAGGHGGLVSIFLFSNSFHQPEIVDGFVDDPGAHIPLMSFKAHSGWVSAVSLARSSQGKANLLLTASNDASVKLWDLNQNSALLNTPKLVFNNTNLHDKGIFGMDVCGDSVLTCSKDKTVVLSQFRSDSGQLEMKQRFEEHVGVRFARCNPQIFASGGNDRELRLFDARVAMNPNVATIGGVHSRAINSVQFHPTDDNLLLSAGFDPDFYLFDVRNTSISMCTFHQRDDTSKGIFHPIFVRNGLGVVAARGHYLLLYRTSDN